MKKIVGAVAVAAVLGAMAIAANSASSATRPNGVSAADWIAITDRFGLVVEPAEGPAREPMAFPLTDRTVLLRVLRPPVGGYFMVRRGDAWVRVVIVEPAKGPGDAG